MKKIILIFLIAINLVTVQANDNIPTYKIIANSNSEKDIEEIYNTKDQLIKDFAKWSKSVDDNYQVLADHTKEYNASFYNGQYIIKIGEAKGKELTGKLQASYCSSTKEIKKKSFLAELFS